MTPTKHADRIERVIRFPRPLYGKLKRSAKRNGRSANAEVMRAVEHYLEREQ